LTRMLSMSWGGVRAARAGEEIDARASRKTPRGTASRLCHFSVHGTHGHMSSVSGLFAPRLGPTPTKVGDLAANDLGASLLGLGAFPTAHMPAEAAPQRRWVGVVERFETFNKNLLPTQTQVEDGRRKAAGVIACLNTYYYGVCNETENSFYIGSWGKGTATRPPRDIDLYFVLPPHVYARFKERAGNQQSQLLQEARSALLGRYPGTDIAGDRQVVVVPFESYGVEVVPAFGPLNDGSYAICDTSSGGSYTFPTPHAELAFIDAEDRACNGDLRPLVRMLKAWQRHCDVPIKSFQLEIVAACFVKQSPWRGNGWFWFDWIMRDFFTFLLSHENGVVLMPGTGERVELGRAWKSHAETAQRNCIEACRFEYENWTSLAGDEWRKIFGIDVPGYIAK